MVRGWRYLCRASFTTPRSCMKRSLSSRASQPTPICKRRSGRVVPRWSWRSVASPCSARYCHIRPAAVPISVSIVFSFPVQYKVSLSTGLLYLAHSCKGKIYCSLQLVCPLCWGYQREGRTVAVVKHTPPVVGPWWTIYDEAFSSIAMSKIVSCCFCPSNHIHVAVCEGLGVQPE